MQAVFEGEQEGCHLYSRHTNPSTSYLCKALAGMENTEAAYVTASGMGAITSCTLQICKSGDEIIASRTIYGGTYAFFKNFLPKLGIKVHFIDITKTEQIEELINARELARSQKNFEEADSIRAKLEEKGIILEDTANGVRWSIVN